MPPATRRGTGFVGLQQYLGLNQGAAQRMGDTLASGVEAAGAGVQSDTQAAKAKALEAISQGSLAMPGEGTTAAQAKDKATRTYTGPMGMDAGTVTDLYGRAAGVQRQAQALGSNTGRATLLGQKYGSTSWGGGQLDAALAGAGPSGARVSGAAGAYGRLLGQLGGAQSTVQQAARTASDATSKAAKAYGELVPGLEAKETTAAAEAKAAKEKADLEAQQQAEADAAAGGFYRTGGNARGVADERRRRAPRTSGRAYEYGTP